MLSIRLKCWLNKVSDMEVELQVQRFQVECIMENKNIYHYTNRCIAENYTLKWSYMSIINSLSIHGSRPVCDTVYQSAAKPYRCVNFSNQHFT